MVNNKFIGQYTTQGEHGSRECLILTYGIPLNNEYTAFDPTHSLIVDLRACSSSIADEIRDLSLTKEANALSTFMEFAAKRKSRSRNVELLTHLVQTGSIKKVPASDVFITVRDQVKGEYNVYVTEINAEIEKALGQRTTSNAAVVHPKVDEYAHTPLSERNGFMSTEVEQLTGEFDDVVGAHEYEEEPQMVDFDVVSIAASAMPSVGGVSVVSEPLIAKYATGETQGPQDQVQILTNQVAELTNMVATLVETLTTPPRRGRPPKEKTAEASE